MAYSRALERSIVEVEGSDSAKGASGHIVTAKSSHVQVWVWSYGGVFFFTTYISIYISIHTSMAKPFAQRASCIAKSKAPFLLALFLF